MTPYGILRLLHIAIIIQQTPLALQAGNRDLHFTDASTNDKREARGLDRNRRGLGRAVRERERDRPVALRVERERPRALSLIHI